jgi:serine/threonine protein kinase
MSGGSLREQIDKVIITKEPFSEEKIIEYSCQFAEGLLELKAKGIIHRDLRPENVLIHNDQIKFGDFDSAFIKGYSDYRNIKNGVDMKETTPL